MLKKIVIVLILVFSTSVFAQSSYDRTVEVLDNSRDEKVKEVFRELIAAYQDEDAREFLEHVSEDRFLQDYISFSDAIYQDFRYYDILQVDYWFDQIVPKGQVKRFLYVRWEKMYENLETSIRFNQRGYSRFLFDEIDGKYKLIELAGNNLWADSVEEWTDEVPSISGQEDVQEPDLIVESITCTDSDTFVNLKITNIGTGTTKAGSIEWSIKSVGVDFDGVISKDIAAGEYEKVSIFINCNGSYSGTVDPDNKIPESNNDNNTKIGL